MELAGLIRQALSLRVADVPTFVHAQGGVSLFVYGFFFSCA